MLLVMVTGLLALPALAQLSGIKSMPDPEKRSEAALLHAEKQLKAARISYQDVRMEEVEGQIREATEAVVLSLESLEATRKDPRKKSKYFKKAEIKTRQLLREADQFSQAMSVNDRQIVDPLIQELRRVNEALVLGVMGAKPRKE
jgi:Na+-transporting NADH:ubiquinone oxidoreductase subunit NqrC